MALGVAAILGGCGNNQSASSLPTPGSTGSVPKVAATGPAISTPLTFDQLPFESAVKKVKNKDGLVFLQFSYADADNKIYKCELPEAMSIGSYSPEEWRRTFKIYRLPQVIGIKKPKKSGPVVIGDFPFISPKPEQVQQPGQEGAPTTPQPISMPDLLPKGQPGQPSAPATMPMSPRPIPSAGAAPPRD